MIQVTAIIPSYEPTEKLLAIVSMLREKTGYRIVIVDDGSGEHYRAFYDDAAALGCVILRHDANRGKGAALKTAFTWMIENHPGEPLVCVDSDGQQRIEDIRKIAEAIRPDGREMVYGTRMFEGKVPIRSRFGNWIMRLVFRTITGVCLYDTQSGLRGYPPSLLPWLISVGGDRFEYETNLLLHAKEAGVTFHEFRIQTIYENNNKGSHYRALRDSARIYRCLWNYRRTAKAAKS
jgi:glycosyltransferase involved in cell wall biosynthesis